MTRQPERIRLRRTKGWRKPEGAVVVSRPSRWGNPFTLEWARLGDDPNIGDAIARRHVVDCYRQWLTDEEWAAQLGRLMASRRKWILANLHTLAGHDLGCWCPLNQPCHADVLLELAAVWEYGVRGFDDIAGRPVDIPMPEAEARQCIEDCRLLGHRRPKTLVRRIALGPWCEVTS